MGGPIGIDVQDNGDGTFTARYDHPLPSGDYVIHVLLENQPVINFPKKLCVQKTTVDPKHSFAEGPGLNSPLNDNCEESKIKQDGPGCFTIYALDENDGVVPDTTCEV